MPEEKAFVKFIIFVADIENEEYFRNLTFQLNRDFKTFIDEGLLEVNFLTYRNSKTQCNIEVGK